MKQTLLIFTALFINVFAYTQVPQKMNYQAVVRNSSDELVSNHTVGMKISILKGSANGTVVYSETTTPMTDANGLLTIEIGNGPGFENIDWANGPYFFKTEIDPDGGTNYSISGTSQLLSVPYALLANTISDVDLTGAATNDLLRFDGTKWVKFTPNYIVSEVDGSIANEIQTLTLNDDDLTISGTGGNTVTFTNWDKDYSNDVRIIGDQTIGDNKTFSNDVTINGITVGKGKSSIASNTAVGYLALSSNTTGNNNSANGKNALSSNTIGNDNTANGSLALTSNTTGKNNTATGSGALYSNNFGYHNTANGSNALYSNTFGFHNTANGKNALYLNTTGHSNTANGFEALSSNTTAYGNTANGSNALYFNTTGNDNTANGGDALLSNTTGNDNTANGVEALLYNTIGYDNTSNGSHSLYYNTSGYGNTADGASTLYTNTTGHYNTAIGYDAGVSSGDLYNATAIGYYATVNASNKVVIGNSDVSAIGGFATWTNFSDRRLKENIVYKNDLGLSFINKLQTVSYNYKSDSLKHRRDGLIAQDVKKALDELGLQFSGLVIDDDKDKTMNLSYGDLVVPLINAVQDLSKQNSQLNSEITPLTKRVDDLNRQNLALKDDIAKLIADIEILKKAIK